MAMRRVLFLSLLVLFAFVLVCTFSADDSSAEVCDNVRVYIQNSDGTYDETVVSGVQTVREAVQTAAAEQGKNMKLNITSTNVLSVDDVKNDSDHQWRIFQWLPPGKPGWGVQIFGLESDGKMSSGTTYCINFSTMPTDSPRTTSMCRRYSLPKSGGMGSGSRAGVPIWGRFLRMLSTLIGLGNSN